MLSRPLKAALVSSVLATSTLLALVPTGAAAQTVATVDAADDVYRGTVQEDETMRYERIGTVANADLLRTQVRHTSSAVVVRAQYAKLAKSADPFMLMTRLRRPDGSKLDVVVHTLARARGHHSLQTARGRELRCDGLRHTVEYSTDEVRVTVPRSCLGRPTWVQAFHLSMAMEPEGGLLFDHGHLEEMREQMRWTSRIRRA